jgi:hypothetical protein
MDEPMPSKEVQGSVECFYCREEIRGDARKCRYCGELVDTEQFDRVFITEWEYTYGWYPSVEKSDKSWRELSHGRFSYEDSNYAYIWQDYAALESALGDAGRGGWELVAAVPRWSWALVVDQSPPDPVFHSYPSHIVGWYCIFKRSPRRELRRVDRSEQARSVDADAGEAN